MSRNTAKTKSRIVRVLMILGIIALFIIVSYDYNFDSDSDYDLGSVVQSKAYTIRMSAEKADPRNYYIEVLKNGRKVYSGNGVGNLSFVQMSEDILAPIEVDLTGDGPNNIVIKNLIDSKNNESVYHIFKVSDAKFEKIAEVQSLQDVEFKDINNDGIFEICGSDDAFDFLVLNPAPSPDNINQVTYFDLPLPRIILSFNFIDNKFKPNTPLMFNAIVTPDDLQKLALNYHDDDTWNLQGKVPAKLIRDVIELLYIGKETEAFNLLDNSWGLDPEIIDGYKTALKESLRNSNFYQKTMGLSN